MKLNDLVKEFGLEVKTASNNLDREVKQRLRERPPVGCPGPRG